MSAEKTEKLIDLGFGNPAVDGEMASTPPVALPESFGGTRAAGARASPTLAKPGSSLREEAIWRRLREAGFDEDTVKRRDKASLIAYVTALEAEV